MAESVTYRGWTEVLAEETYDKLEDLWQEEFAGRELDDPSPDDVTRARRYYTGMSKFFLDISHNHILMAMSNLEISIQQGGVK